MIETDHFVKMSLTVTFAATGHGADRTATGTLFTLVRESCGVDAKTNAAQSSAMSTDRHFRRMATMPRSSLHMTSELQQAEKLMSSVRPTSTEQTDESQLLDEFDRRPMRLPAGTLGLKWSRQAPLLKEKLSQLMPFQQSPLLTREGLLSFLAHLDLCGHAIRRIDEEFATSSATEVSLSRNKLQTLQNLPTGLRSLQAYHNNVDSIHMRQALPSLLHLGLGHNAMRGLDWPDTGAGATARGAAGTVTIGGVRTSSGASRRTDGVTTRPGTQPSPAPLLRSLPSCFPGLVSLDLGHNSLLDLRGTLAILSQLGKLRHLVLAGNPCALTVNYCVHVLSALPQLESLDDRPLPPLNKAHMNTQWAASGRPFGLAQGAVHGVMDCTLVVEDVAGLPTPESVFAHFGLSPTGPSGASYASPSTASCVLQVSLGGLYNSQIGPLNTWKEEVAAAPVPTLAPAAGKAPSRPTSAAKPVAAVVPSAPSSPRAAGSDKTYPPLSAVVAGHTAPLPLVCTVETRDALERLSLVLTVLECRSDQRAPVGTSSISLSDLVQPSDAAVVTAGSIRGADVPKLKLSSLPSAAESALQAVREAVASAHAARVAYEAAKAQAEAEARAAAEAEAASAESGASRPPSAAGSKAKPASKPGSAGKGAPPTPAALGPTAPVLDPTITALATQGPWTDREYQVFVQEICKKAEASSSCGVAVKLRLVDLTR